MTLIVDLIFYLTVDILDLATLDLSLYRELLYGNSYVPWLKFLAVISKIQLLYILNVSLI
nr:MAG TPA: hypothetical protein [Caudoviricetes sp.]